jgi:hypothetical protein
MNKLTFSAIIFIIARLVAIGQNKIDESIGFRYYLNDSIKRINYFKTNFDSIREFGYKFTIGKKNGKWGWNKNKFIYEQIEVAMYTDYLANEIIFTVKQNGKWGVVDVNHKLLLPIKYDNQLNGTFDGNFITTKKDSLIVITQNGTEILKTKAYGQLRKPEWYIDWGNYDSVVNPKILIIDGKSEIRGNPTNGKYGYIDYSGRILYNQVIDTFAILKVRPDSGIPYVKGFLLNIGGKSKEYHATNEPYYIIDSLDEYIEYERKVFNKMVTGGKWGIIDTKGKEIVPLVFDEIKLNYLFGDRGNETEHRISYADSLNYKFNDNLTAPNWIFVRKGNLWGVFDFGGRQIIPIELPNCPTIEKYCDGISLSRSTCYYIINSDEYNIEGVLKIKGKYGLLDENGKISHKIDADNIIELLNYSNKDSLVTIGFLWNKGGKAYTCAYQHELINSTFHFTSDIIVGGLFGFVNTMGIEILPVEFEDIRFDLNFEDDVKGFNKHLWSKSDSAFCEFGSVIQSIVIVKKDAKFGVFNFNGQKILPIEYDNIEVEIKKGQKVINATKNKITIYFDYSGKRLNY